MATHCCFISPLLFFILRNCIMSQSTYSSVEVALKCRCGNGDMRLFTSHTKSNSNRKFWGCPKWTVSVLHSVISYVVIEGFKPLCLISYYSLFKLTCVERIWMWRLPLERQSLNRSFFTIGCGAMRWSWHPSWFAEAVNQCRRPEVENGDAKLTCSIGHGR